MPHIVALGAAARLASERLPLAAGQLAALRDELYRGLLDAVPGLLINGHPEHRLPNTLHVSFPGVSGRDLLARCAAQVSASVGSACHSHGDAVSGVLAAIGCGAERARGAVRLSVGAMTTSEQATTAAAALADSWRALR